MPDKIVKSVHDAQLATRLASYLTDLLSTPVTFGEVLDELLLMSLGQEPVNDILAAYIKDSIETINNL